MKVYNAGYAPLAMHTLAWAVSLGNGKPVKLRLGNAQFAAYMDVKRELGQLNYSPEVNTAVYKELCPAYELRPELRSDEIFVVKGKKVLGKVENLAIPIGFGCYIPAGVNA